MLIADPSRAGTESGLMIPQYAAASLVMENQHLANSDAVHSIPTSANQEDHNSNSLNAARHAMTIAKNVLSILAIERYCLAHALDIRMRNDPDHKMASGTHAIYEEIRNIVDFQEHEIVWGEEIHKVLDSLEQRLFSV